MRKIFLSVLVLALGISFSNINLFGNKKANSLLLQNVEFLDNPETSTGHEKDQPLKFRCGAPLNGGHDICKFMVISCQGGGSGCTPRPCSVHG